MDFRMPRTRTLLVGLTIPIRGPLTARPTFPLTTVEEHNCSPAHSRAGNTFTLGRRPRGDGITRGFFRCNGRNIAQP
jgi:hypothetical protein